MFRHPSPGLVTITTDMGYAHTSSAGAGIVLSSSGDVLTTNQLIQGATVIHVNDPASHRTFDLSLRRAGYFGIASVVQLSPDESTAAQKPVCPTGHDTSASGLTNDSEFTFGS